MEISGQLMAAERYGGESTPTIKENENQLEATVVFLVVSDQLNATLICAQRS